MKLILATESPYRKRLFETFGYDFECEKSGFDEDYKGRSTNPKQLVQDLSKGKAINVSERNPEAVVIGFDSLAFFNNKYWRNQNQKKKRKKE